MVEPFVIVGKAKEVFRLIEIKAKREQEMKSAIKDLREEVTRVHFRPVRVVTESRACPFDSIARCNKPFSVTCEYLQCPIWKEIDGE